MLGDGLGGSGRGGHCRLADSSAVAVSLYLQHQTGREYWTETGTSTRTFSLLAQVRLQLTLAVTMLHADRTIEGRVNANQSSVCLSSRDRWIPAAVMPWGRTCLTGSRLPFCFQIRRMSWNGSNVCLPTFPFSSTVRKSNSTPAILLLQAFMPDSEPHM